MIWKILALSAISVLTGGCISLMAQNPTLDDLKGSWVSTGPVSFFQLSVDKKGAGLLAIVFDEETSKLYKLTEYQSFEQGFTMKLIDTKGEEQPVSLEGEIILGRLALKDTSDPEVILWFIKSEDFFKYRKIATDDIQAYQ